MGLLSVYYSASIIFPLWDAAIISSFVILNSLNTSFLFPFPGDSAVSVGERVPGACLLPPPYGPGGAFPVAWPDDALSLGQHYRPREADPVSPGICHWPQVSLCIYSLVDMHHYFCFIALQMYQSPNMVGHYWMVLIYYLSVFRLQWIF